MFSLHYDGQAMHPLLLSFNDRTLEAEYQHDRLPFQKSESRLGLFIVVLSWLVYAVFARSLVPGEVADTIQALAVGTLALFMLALIACHLRGFQPYHQIIMLMCSLVAFGDVTVKVWLTPSLSTAYFFPAILMLSLWSFALAGNRFIYSLVIPVVFSLAYLWIQAGLRGKQYFEFNNSLFYLFCAFGMGLTVSWYKEYQSRVIFLARRQLDSERQMHLHASLHDALTGLPNRVLLKDRIEQEILKAHRTGHVHAGIFIDLDGFKKLNDTLGHQAGDAFLKEVARRYAETVRETDTVARISGDEFFVLAADIGGNEEAMGLASKLLACMEAPVTFENGTSWPGVGASVGICIFPFDNSNADAIIRRADAAMYDIKKTTKGAIGLAA